MASAKKKKKQHIWPWVFAPFFGNGHGGSAATLPHNNVIDPKTGKAPNIPGDGSTRTTPAPGGGDGDGDEDDMASAPAPGGAGAGSGGSPSGGGAGSGAGGGGGSGGAGGGAMGASLDKKDNSMSESRKKGLSALNEDLDFMTRVIAAPVKVGVPGADPTGGLNGMTDVPMDEYDELGLDLGPLAGIQPTVGPMVSPYANDPLAPMGMDCGGCEPYGDPDVDIDELPDLSDDDEPDAQDVLGAVLTILNAAMGF